MDWHPDQGVPTRPLTKCMLGEVPALFNTKQNKWFRKWMDDWYKNDDEDSDGAFIEVIRSCLVTVTGDVLPCMHGFSHFCFPRQK